MKLNDIFCDGAVLQAGKTVRIFGEGDGHAKVCIGERSAEADSVCGKWLVELPAFDYGGPYEVKIDLNGSVTLLHDVYFGDVILMVGQSNLQLKLSESSAKEDDYINNPLMRCFTLERLEDNEYFKPSFGWVKCEKESAGHWSAVGYHLAERISRRKGNAVGIIACYQGASIIQSWLPEDIASRDEFFIPEDKRSYDHTAKMYSKWNTDGTLYHFMFEKIIPCRLSHIVWYQGESNTSDAEAAIYADMLTALIRRYRTDLSDEALPFVIVQIADFDSRRDEAWKTVQEKQSEVAASVPGVTLAVSADVCEKDDIHPKTKSKLAERIADIIIGK